MPRKIIHLDLDAFFCSVEELLEPSLRGLAFAVGGQPGERGVVASCSYAARLCGVHSAMPMGTALRQCPQLRIVPARHQIYGQYSERVMEALNQLTPLVEQVSIDEAFMDISDMAESSESLARALQERIRKEIELPCSLGAASNKLVAKIATDVGKAAARKGLPPCAITIVPPGQEAEFLAPLPVGALWGVGPKTGARLAELGIHTIGQLAAWPEQELHARFGKSGVEMSRHARGLDDSPLVTSHETKSISQETTFVHDLRDLPSLQATLGELSEGVGRQLRQSHLLGSTVKLKLRWADFTTLTRQMTLDRSTDLDSEILTAALELFEKTWPPGKPVRLLGVGISGLGPPVRQLSLWDQGSEKDRRLQAVLDDLRKRFGKHAVQRGAKNKDHDD